MPLKRIEKNKDALFIANEGYDSSTCKITPKFDQKVHDLHAIPAHTGIRPSPLSKESIDQNYRGFLHLVILLLVVNMLRLALENFKRYGFLISAPGKNVYISDLKCIFMVWTFLLVSTIFVFMAEWTIKNRIFNGKPLHPSSNMAIYMNISALLIVPAFIVWTRGNHPVVSTIALMTSLSFGMKTISYHLVNAELRALRLDGRKGIGYPENINLPNFLYFWMAPTLCYQLLYPRSPNVRPKFILQRLLEFAACLTVIHLITEQYTIPLVQNSLKSMQELDLLGILERLLKLSVCSLYIWLLAFYALFHSFLNMAAEILLFGDRGFYKAWWNAKSIEEYWRLWNWPVHIWLKRHVYRPLVSRGWSGGQAQIMCFIISAIAHEYLIAIPTQVIQGWAFLAMLFQIPLISITKWYMSRHKESSFGNYFFWIIFCILGQPMCILLYYRAWVTKTYPGLHSSVNAMPI